MAPPGPGARRDRAFERLYRRHVEDVYRYALAVLGNRADAEDVTQSAFLNAYRAFQGGLRPEQPLNWLIAIAHNVCRQRFRDASRRPREVVLERELAADADEPETREFGQDDIRRALSQLSFSQRSALALRELEGRSYKEIAAVLDLTEAAVETLIFRARRAFREQLEGTLSCDEAERAISRQLDGMLARAEKAGLRAHLRGCRECASLARRLRAQRTALRGIVVLPLPQTLATFSATGGSVAGGAALGLKAAALGAAALVAAGVGTEVARHSPGDAVQPAAARSQVRPSRAEASRSAIAVQIGRDAPAARTKKEGTEPVTRGRDGAKASGSARSAQKPRAPTATAPRSAATLVRAASWKADSAAGRRSAVGRQGAASGRQHGGKAAGSGTAKNPARTPPARGGTQRVRQAPKTTPAATKKEKVKPTATGPTRVVPIRAGTPANGGPGAAGPAPAAGEAAQTLPAEAGGPPAEPPGQSGGTPGAAAKEKDKDQDGKKS